jgi:hypothetical protein
MDAYVTTSLFDWRLWLAFFLHDIGYWGLEYMDDAQGELHPLRGAWLVSQWGGHHDGEQWYKFSIMHSRYMAQRWGGAPLSNLYGADKLAIALTPWWLYVPLTRLTGEIREYREAQKNRDDYDMHGHRRGRVSFREDVRWYREVQAKMRIQVKAWQENPASVLRSSAI